MTVRDLLHNTFVSPSLAPAARNASETGEAVDLRGFDAAVIAVAFGAYTDGTHTPSLEHSMDGDSYAAVAASDSDGSFTPVSSEAGANAVQSVGYVGARRYVRVVMTVEGATTGAVASANVIAGYPHHQPAQ